MLDILVGKHPFEPVLPFNPILASTTIFANVPPSSTSLSPIDHSLLLSWLHDEQGFLTSHGDPLASLIASTNSCLAMVSTWIDDLQGTLSSAPQVGGSALTLDLVSDP